MADADAKAAPRFLQEQSKQEMKQARDLAKQERKQAMDLAREKIRASKADALQQARRHKQQKSIASKFLPKVVKAQFNISSLLVGKPGRMISETDHAEGQRLKTALVATDNKLRRFIFVR